MASGDSGLPALALHARGVILTILLFAVSHSAAQEAPAVNTTSLPTPANWEETCTPEVFHSLTYHYRSCARKFFHYEDPGEDGFIQISKTALVSMFSLIFSLSTDCTGLLLACYVPNVFVSYGALTLFQSRSSFSNHLRETRSGKTARGAASSFSEALLQLQSSSASILLVSSGTFVIGHLRNLDFKRLK
jgi:hypothetical protein